MSAPALRPLRVGEILDAGIKVYLRNARTLMGLTAAIVVPFQALSAVILLSIVSNGREVPSGVPRFGTTRAGDHAASVGAQVILSLTSVLIGLLTTAAAVKAVSDIYLDQPAGIGDSLRFALRRIGSLVWLEILTGVLLAVAFVALVIPGIWLYGAWALATPALLIEGCRGWTALSRSFRLVRGRWWPTAAVLIVAAVMVSVVGGAIEAALVGIALAGGSSVVLTVTIVSLAAAVSAILTRPFQAAVRTVLYYDLRVRHEGYDIELLAEQLGIEPAALPAGGWADAGPETVGAPGGPPFWPPPPGWSPPPAAATPTTGGDGEQH